MEIPKHKLDELKAYDSKLSAKINEEGQVAIWRETPRGRVLINTCDKLDNRTFEELEWGNLMKQTPEEFEAKLPHSIGKEAQRIDALKEKNARDAWNYRRKQTGFVVPKYYAGAARKVS